MVSEVCFSRVLSWDSWELRFEQTRHGPRPRAQWQN